MKNDDGSPGNNIEQNGNNGKYARIFSKLAAVIMITGTICIILYMIYAVIFWNADNQLGSLRCKEIKDNWSITYEDGRSSDITLPYNTEAEKGSVVVTSTILPTDISDNDFIALRSYRQNVKVYINDELRCDYSMKEGPPYRRDLPSIYVYADIDSKDAGGILRIESVRKESKERAYSQVYYGERAGIIVYYIMKQGVSICFALVFLIMAVLSIVVGTMISIVTKSDTRVDYMGWAILCIVLWNIGQSDFRDFIYPNIKAISMVPAMGLMLLPFPICLYYNSIQKRRYWKLYTGLFALSLINFIHRLYLQFNRVSDIYDSINIDFVLLGLYIVGIAYTIIMDIKEKLIDDYKISAVAFIVLIFGGVGQMVLFLTNVNGASATLLSSAVTVVALMSFLETIFRINRINMENRAEIMANRLKQDFLANMSHEIRTPINAVLGMNEAILKESGEENIIEYATDVDNAGRLLLSIINDILDFSKLDSGKMSLLESDYSVKDIVTACNSLIEGKVVDKGLRFNVVIPEDTFVNLRGDDVRIQQIMINILSNAVKYTDKGEITLKLFTSDAEDDRVTLNIRVKDTGIGIKDEDKEKLFTAFARVDENRNKNIEGTGLGLNITSRLVRLMGGSVTVESEYGKGSEFIVRIPQILLNNQTIGQFDVAEPVVHSVSKYMDGGIYAPGAKILVIDDVKMNLKVVQSFLKFSGIQVDTALSGDEGIELVKKNRYHIIFLDHMMPGKDGIETLKEMREAEDNLNIGVPVIMFTANVSKEARNEYLEGGFDDYVAKPISYTDMNEVIRKYLPLDAYIEKKVARSSSDRSVIASIGKGIMTANDDKDMDISDFLDHDTAMQYCAGSEEVFEEILKTYAEDDLRGNLIESFERNDWDNYRVTVHAIKSTSKTIGATELSDFAKEMEAYAKENRISEIASRHEALIEEYGHLIDLIRDKYDISQDMQNK
ncbi:MAG: response regulator [Lachnospiraceae bacterium]|nr:response regulator [Lachnospiraceae bacterium]